MKYKNYSKQQQQNMVPLLKKITLTSKEYYNNILIKEKINK